MYRVVVVVFFVRGTLCQFEQRGQCSPAQAVSEIKTSSMLGKWYQIERIPNIAEMGDCSTTTFGMRWFKGTISNREVVNGIVRYRDGTVTKDGQLFTADYGSEQNDFYVSVTDYKDYALLYSCQDVSSDRKKVWGWKLSRSKTMSSAGQAAIDEAIATNPDLQVTWRKVEQDDC